MKIAKSVLTVMIFFALLLLQHCNKPVSDIPYNDIGKLKRSLDSVIAQSNATVGLYVFEIESGLALGINERIHFPMQSVYKIPLAIAVLNRVEKGEIALKQVESLLMSAISDSDNPASEKLFELIGGTKTANDFMHKNGFSDIRIGNTPEQPDTGYKYSCTPKEMSRLLERLYKGKLLNKEHTRLLLNYMIESKSSTRLKGMLPAETVVAHKIGTGTHTCHDVGIIYLPNEKHLAISVFVNDAKGSMEETERIIAVLTKQVFEFYVE